MAYVIGAACVDIMDQSCVEDCPIDCIYTGARKLYIHPEECIDCGACARSCPVDAISWDRDLDPADPDIAHIQDAAAFFYQPLPGQPAPLREPGGAAGLGPVGVDTALITAIPAQGER
ncbi:ferredoxin [Pseudofrankia inefficax]|uniref:Ferredoxin n=1 Tax=Pseudofrankia inefficax (strain DSM 45817 / CECT 9037 / DDB 130130 / EuI1c) TaxID=298654 RepID=E3JCB4_PSEI1|nr:ferredoxin [Pseudofrankia inefficax]ADP84703.1 ferredoxin [Pseudofrankia inefficax]